MSELFKYEVPVRWEMEGTMRIVSSKELSTEEAIQLTHDRSNINEVAEPYEVQGSFKVRDAGVSRLMPCGACGEESWWTDEDDHECEEEDNE